MLLVNVFNLAILSCIFLSATVVETRSSHTMVGEEGGCCREYRQRMEFIRDLNVKIAERIKYLLEIEKKRIKNEQSHTCSQSTQPIHNQIVIQLSGQNKSNLNEPTSPSHQVSKVEVGNTPQEQQPNMGIDFNGIDFLQVSNGEIEKLVNEAVEHSKCPIGKVFVHSRGCVPIIENIPINQENSVKIIDNESEIINSNFKIINEKVDNLKITGSFAIELEGFLKNELERLKTFKSETSRKIELKNLQLLCNKIKEKMNFQIPSELKQIAQIFQSKFPNLIPQPPKYEGKLFFPNKPAVTIGNYNQKPSGMEMTIENLENELENISKVKSNEKDKSKAFLSFNKIENLNNNKIEQTGTKMTLKNLVNRLKNISKIKPNILNESKAFISSGRLGNLNINRIDQNRMEMTIKNLINQLDNKSKGKVSPINEWKTIQSSEKIETSNNNEIDQDGIKMTPQNIANESETDESGAFLHLNEIENSNNNEIIQNGMEMSIKNLISQLGNKPKLNPNILDESKAFVSSKNFENLSNNKISQTGMEMNNLNKLENKSKIRPNEKDESEAFLNLDLNNNKIFETGMKTNGNLENSNMIAANTLKKIIENGKEIGNELAQGIEQQMIKNQIGKNAKMILENSEMKIESENEIPSLTIESQFSRPGTLASEAVNKLKVNHNEDLNNFKESLNSMTEQKTSNINEMMMNANNKEMNINHGMEINFAGQKLHGIDGESLSQSKFDTSRIVHPKNQLTKMYLDMMASLKKGKENSASSEMIANAGGNQISISASSVTNLNNQINKERESNLYNMILNNKENKMKIGGNMEMNIGTNFIENLKTSKNEFIIKLLELWKSEKTYEIELLLKEKPELIEIYNHIKSAKAEAQTNVEEEIKKEEFEQIDEGEIGLSQRISSNAGEAIQNISNGATELKQILPSISIPNVKIIKEEIPAKIIMKAQLPNGKIMKVSEHSLNNITNAFEMNIPIPVVQAQNVKLPFGSTIQKTKRVIPLKPHLKFISGRRSNQNEENVQSTTTGKPSELINKKMSIFSFDPKNSKNPKALIQHKIKKEEIGNILKNLKPIYDFKSIADVGIHLDENQEHSANDDEQKMEGELVENKTKQIKNNEEEKVEQKSISVSENYGEVEETVAEKSTTKAMEISTTESTTTVNE
ncbi:hypothetical protein PVAND_004766 [Polypedilum vanderplanki]|uniref:Uncharacterized protein n=1 Tax=Polypedilum vanderplanki TaxID=319348 RepID=A0A9J6BZ34_POLVA|nr:hypothetical protein PVAND_004766 [Polypedilum vanderplanki]